MRKTMMAFAAIAAALLAMMLPRASADFLLPDGVEVGGD